MGYIIGMPIILAIAFIIFLIGIYIAKAGEDDGDKAIGITTSVVSLVVGGLIFVIWTAAAMIHQVPAGEGVIIDPSTLLGTLNSAVTEDE